MIKAVRDSQFIGPKDSPQARRDKFAHDLNETSSLRDHVFEGKVPPELGFLTDPQLIDQYKEMIEQHVERRVIFLFQQLVACCGTQLHFEIGETRHQAESAPALYAHREGQLAKQSVRNAAHSSTIPSLIAYRKEEWNAYQRQENGQKPEGFVYLKGTDIYRTLNATLDMPRAINQADIAIDGTKGGSSLRSKTIELINRAASGEISPEQGVESFLRAIIKQVELATKKSSKEGVKIALQSYEVILKQIQRVIHRDPQIFARWLDVQIDPATDTALVRRAIYHIRYEAIQSNLFGQASIFNKIESVKTAVFSHLSKSLPHKEKAFRHALVELADERNKPRFRKLFNLPGEGPNLRYNSSKEKVLAHRALLAPLVHEVSRDMERMRHDEVRQRASITKTLRHIKSWTQRELSDEIRKAFPNLPSSQSTLSRIETGKRTVDVDYAQKLSSVFHVDAGLFMPHFFYE